MSNKKVIRKKLNGGDFTQIPLSILKDKRLSAIEFRLLISILSDSDNFDLIQATYANRHGHDKNTISDAIERLEELGYLRVTRDAKNRPIFYVVSEFGNLNKENKSNENEQLVEFDSDESIEILCQFIDYFDPEELNQMIESFTDSETNKIKLGMAKESLEKTIKIRKEGTFQLGLSFSSKERRENRNLWSTKASKHYENWLRSEIYDKGNLLTKQEMNSMWITINSRYSTLRQDFETIAIGD